MTIEGRLFADQEHYDFYIKTCARYKVPGYPLDCYAHALLYLLALCDDTRRHFADLFDIKEADILQEGLCRGWQTGGTRKSIRLAFNLWNGTCSDTEELESGSSSGYDALDELFCFGSQRYFFEAVRLRFPEYAASR